MIISIYRHSFLNVIPSETRIIVIGNIESHRQRETKTISFNGKNIKISDLLKPTRCFEQDIIWLVLLSK